MTDDESYERDEFDKLRALAREIGMPAQIRPEQHDITLPTSADFVRRMQERALDEPPVPPAKPRRLPTWSRAVLLAAAASAVVLALLVAPWSGPTASAHTPPVLDFQFAKAANIAFAPGAPARADLLLLSKSALSGTSPTKHGSVQYVQTDNWFSSREEIAKSSKSRIIPTVGQSWLAADGSQTVVETPGQPLRADGRGLAATSSADPAAARGEELPAGTFDARRVAKLGSTPGQVKPALLEAAECDENATQTARARCLYQEVAGLFAQHVVPPRTASLIWAALASEPGFRSLGSVTDRAGREGIGISVVSTDVPEFRSILIVSRTNGQLLGTEDILIKSSKELDLKAPAISSFTAILVSKYTEDRPRVASR